MSEMLINASETLHLVSKLDIILYTSFIAVFASALTIGFSAIYNRLTK